MRKPFSPEDLYRLVAVEDAQISPDGKRAAFVRVVMDKTSNCYKRTIWLSHVEDKERAPFQLTWGPRSDYAPRWSPDGKFLAFLSDRGGKPELYALPMEGGEAYPLTSTRYGVWHASWSPDGRRFAFVSSANKEDRKKEDSKETEPPAETALEQKYRSDLKDEAERRKTDPRVITSLPYRTGTDYLIDRTSHIYVANFDPSERTAPKARRITDGEINFSDIAWTRNGRFIISTQSRDPEHNPWFKRAIIRLNADGPRRRLRFMTKPGYEYFSPQVSPDGRYLAFTRQVDQGSFGRNAVLAVMPLGGGNIRDLTLALDRHVDAFQWASDSKHIYFLSGSHGDEKVHRVVVRDHRIEDVLDGRRFILNFTVSRKNRFAFTAATPERPSEVYIRSGPDEERRLTHFNDELLREREVAKTTEMWYPAPDGRKIQGWVVRSRKTRSQRKHPLVVSMHGGPHVMWGPAVPNIWFEWQVQAARGYVVFYCNPRGSLGYGEEFATIIQNDWGHSAMHDVLAGADLLVQKGFVDQSRMALTGGSYAGFLTAWIVAHDKRFACAWAQRGLYNLASWYGTADIPQLLEREFEAMPFDDMEKFWNQSPLAHVRSIVTPLAIEHQELDFRCPIGDAEQLYTALKRLKRKVVLFRYPREGHEMSRTGEPQHRVDRLERMVAWFDKHCRIAHRAKR